MIGIAGNIGDSFAQQIAEQDFDLYVLELSSFQLDGIDRFCTTYCNHYQYNSRSFR